MTQPHVTAVAQARKALETLEERSRQASSGHTAPNRVVLSIIMWFESAASDPLPLHVGTGCEAKTRFELAVDHMLRCHISPEGKPYDREAISAEVEEAREVLASAWHKLTATR